MQNTALLGGAIWCKTNENNCPICCESDCSPSLVWTYVYILALVWWHFASYLFCSFNLTGRSNELSFLYPPHV